MCIISVCFYISGIHCVLTELEKIANIFLAISAFRCRYNQDNKTNKFRHFHAIVISVDLMIGIRARGEICVRACVLVKSTNGTNSRHMCAV